MPRRGRHGHRSARWPAPAAAGATEEEDRRLAEELLADPKERAEHIMLVDLGRNDVGRVAEFGSGRALRRDDGRALQPRHAHHVERDRPAAPTGTTPSTPCGRACRRAPSRGAPKVRAMQIIDELEPHRRGPYGGAVGYVDFTGNMDTCIALRTLVVQGQTAYVQAGAGIVADSVPASEYEETLNKARGLLKAIEITAARAIGLISHAREWLRKVRNSKHEIRNKHQARIPNDINRHRLCFKHFNFVHLNLFRASCFEFRA